MEKALEILEMIKKDLNELIDHYSDSDYDDLVISLTWNRDLLEICLKWLREEKENSHEGDK